MSTTVTPMMKQYQEAKQACPDALLLFRMATSMKCSLKTPKPPPDC